MFILFLLLALTEGNFAANKNVKAEERLGTHLIRTVASLFTLRTHHNKDKEEEPEIPLYQGYKPTYAAPKPSYNKPSYNKPSYNKPSYNKPTYFAPQPSYDPPRPSYGLPKPSYGAAKPTYFQEEHQDEYGAPQAPLASSYESPKAASLEYGSLDVGYASYSPPVYKRNKAPPLVKPHEEEHYDTESISNYFPSFSSNFPSSSFSDDFDFPTPSFPDISAQLDNWQEWEHYQPQFRSSLDPSPDFRSTPASSSQFGSSPEPPKYFGSSPGPFKLSQLSTISSSTTSPLTSPVPSETSIPGEFFVRNFPHILVKLFARDQK